MLCFYSHLVTIHFLVSFHYYLFYLFDCYYDLLSFYPFNMQFYYYYYYFWLMVSLVLSFMFYLYLFFLLHMYFISLWTILELTFSTWGGGVTPWNCSGKYSLQKHCGFLILHMSQFEIRLILNLPYFFSLFFFQVMTCYTYGFS